VNGNTFIFLGEDKNLPFCSLLPDNKGDERRAGPIQSSEETSARVSRLLDALTTSVHQSLDPETVIDAAANALLKSFPQVSDVEVYQVDVGGCLKCWLTVSRSGSQLSDQGKPIVQGLAEAVMSSHKVLSVSDLAKDDRLDPRMAKRLGLHTFTGIPIHCRENVAGVIALLTRSSDVLTQDDQVICSKAGERIGIALSNAFDCRDATVRTKRYTTISRAIAVTRKLTSLDEVLQDIAKVLVLSADFSQSWIGLVEHEMLRGRAGFGVDMRGKTVTVSYDLKMQSDEINPMLTALFEHTSQFCYDIKGVKDRSLRQWLNKLRVHSFGCIPIISGETPLGVIGVLSDTERTFDAEDIRMLESVAEQAVVAIENARLYSQIKTSEERYRNLFEAAGTSLVILDGDLRFKLVNQAFEALSGYSRHDLVGAMTLPPFLLNKDQSVNDLIKRLKTPPDSWEAHFTDKDGIVKQVHLATSLIPGSADILISTVDMTRERELERRLFRSEELAAIGELSAGIAHEIRNPLVAITASASLLKDETNLSEEGRQLLDVVKEESDHLAAIVDDFLKFARPKKPDFEDVDINQLLRDVIKRYRDWNGSKVKWIEEYDASISTVPMDRHQVQQVVTNLLINSMDAMEKTGVLTVKTQRERASGGECVRVMITDTGIGIPDDELVKIFQPFFSTKQKGTGMGLAICRRIVNDHDGEIVVESRKNEGTTFSVLLPLPENKTQ